jgi:hypothetical protein
MKRRFFSLSLCSLLWLGPFLSDVALFADKSPAAKRMGQAVMDRPFYQIEARYEPDKDEVSGHLSVTLPEVRTEARKEVYFHLYPNVFQHWKFGKESKPQRPGFIHVSRVQVDGKQVRESIQDTVMKVELPEPLQNGRSARIEMDYRLHLPRGGMRLNTFKQTAFLAQWYPMLAVRDGDGWHTEPYTTTGDPFYTVMSDFEVTFDLPEGYRVISTGDDKGTEGKRKVTIRQEMVRDFAAVLTKDYRAVRGTAGNVRVNLWYLPGMERVAKPLHEAAVSGMNFYGERFGSYPYKEVDVVLGETGFGIAGMEYPGLVTSIAGYKGREGEIPAVNVVVHELAHQWWYGVVGNNQVKEPWLDEGLTTFSEFLFMQKKMKANEREWLKRAAERTDEIHEAVGLTSAQSLYDYPDSVYGLMVYIRPAAMMFRLMDEVGEEKVMEILKTYYAEYRYKTATTRDFIRVANRVAGRDLTPFFEKWLYFKSEKAERHDGGRSSG